MPWDRAGRCEGGMVWPLGGGGGGDEGGRLGSLRPGSEPPSPGPFLIPPPISAEERGVAAFAGEVADDKGEGGETSVRKVRRV